MGNVVRGRYLLAFGMALLAALVAMALVLAPSAQSVNKPGDNGCFGKKVTIKGTNGDDPIAGTFESDVIKTFEGDDTVRGDVDFAGTPEGGEDFICLGKGDDVADGADKTDRINGGPGNDTLDGDNFPSPFRDFLFGGPGDDTFTGGQGNDRIGGGPGADTIDVGPPGSTVNQGADTIRAGKGDDTINEFGDGAVDTIECGKGDDTVFADANDKVSKDCETVEEAPAPL